MKAQVAFYRADCKSAEWDDRLISWWTNSPYSHCELVINGIWISASPRDGRVRAKRIVPNPANWDMVDVEVDPDIVWELYGKTVNHSYDWINIWFTQILPFGWQINKWWICSEWVGTAIFGKEYKGNPGDLYRRISNEQVS